MAIIFSLSFFLVACSNGNLKDEESTDKENISEDASTVSNDFSSEASSYSSESEQLINHCSIIIGNLTISLNDNKQDIFSKLDKADLKYSELKSSDSENIKYDSFYGVAGWLQIYFLKDECVRLRLISSSSLEDLDEIPQTTRGLQPYSSYSQMVEKYGSSYETYSYTGKQVYTIYRYSFDNCICEFGIQGENTDTIYNIDIYVPNQYPIYHYGEEIQK